MAGGVEGTSPMSSAHRKCTIEQGPSVGLHLHFIYFSRTA